MNVVVNVAIPVFAIMLAGYLAGRFRLLGTDASSALNTFVYWFALPPVLFLSMARVPFEQIFNWPFLWAYIIGMALAASLAVIVSRWVFGNSFSATTLHTLTATFGNTGYMGIPLMLAAYGSGGTLPAIITTAFGSAVIIGLAILLVEFGEGETSRPGKALRDAVVAVLKGPLFIATIAGIIWQASGLALPEWLVNFGSLMGDAAGPCALFAMGLFLVGKPVSSGVGEVGWMVVLKLFIHPALTWLLAVYVFDLELEMLRGVVLMAALPTGALSFVVAQRYGVFVQRSSAAILFSTVASVVTLSAILAWFSVG
jgi:malonate transporter and related proteins